MGVKIDFSKIKAKELPTKEEEINVLGTLHKVTIKPLTGLARMEYWALNHQDEADERTRKRILLALVNGADFSETEVWQLVTLDWEAALDLSGKIHAFTAEFEADLDKLKAEAEKNLKLASGTVTPA